MEYILADWFFVLIGAVLGLAIGFIISKCIHDDNLAWYAERIKYFEKRERELNEQLILGNTSDVIFDNQGGWKVVPRENEHSAKS